MPADIQIERNEALWYEDGNLILLAENMLFNVHRSVLVRQSDLIRDLLALPSCEGEPEGTVDSPLYLPEVPATGLTNLLQMMYNLWGSELPLSDEEFVEVLLTAHRLQAHDAVKAVLRILDGRLPAERKLHLGLQYDLEFWQLRTFQELVLSFQPVPAAPLLGAPVWVAVLSARAQVSRARIDHIIKTLGSSACGHVVAALVSSVPFAAPDEYRAKYNAYRAKLNEPAVVQGYRGASPFSFGFPAMERHPPACCSSTSFVADGGTNDKMHTVLLPADTENAIIAAFWNSS